MNMNIDNCRYPQVALLIREITMKIRVPVLLKRVCPLNTERGRTWLYGRSIPSLVECAILSLIEVEQSRGEDPMITLKKWISATKITKVATRSKWKIPDNLTDEDLREVLTKASKMLQTPISDGGMINKAALTSFMVIARYLPADLDLDMGLILSEIVADVMSKAALQPSDERVPKLVEALLACFKETVPSP